MSYADNFRVWGPYTRQDGRKIVIVERNGKRRTVSYPKWIMECQLGRELHPDEETVDHKDFNFDNNNVDNLRLVPRDEHSGDDTRRVKNVKLKCDWCEKDFERSPRILRDKSRKGTTGAFCSRSCAGKYNRSVQLGSTDKLPVQPYIESEYYRRKHVEALCSYFLMKYSELSLENELNALRGEMVLAAQQILDDWQPDEEGYDDEFGMGGVCDAIANALGNVVSRLDVEVAEGGQDGDDHAYIVVFTDTEACVVDISPYVYETGGGYSWKKIPGVILKPNDVIIEKIKKQSIIQGIHLMKVFDLSKMVRGWFVGPFEPTVFSIDATEVAVKRYVAGDYESKHHHKISTEITVIVSGRVEMNGVEYGPDDILVIEPGESTDFKCLTDVVTTVVKCPYVKGDKYID